MVKIAANALESVRAKDIAVKFAQDAVSGIAKLIPALRSDGTEAEDALDIETARERLAEISESPKLLVQGKALKKRMSRIET